MVDWLAWLKINGGPVGLLGLCILLIIFGKLVPRSIMEDRIADADKRAADADKRVADAHANAEQWRIAFTSTSSANNLLNRQIDQLLVAARLGGAVFAAIPGQDDGRAVVADETT